MGFKSVRLLNEAIHKEMDAMRKLLMKAAVPGPITDDGQNTIETLNVLRGLFDEMAAFADRPTIAEVHNQSASDYVATMKPLVRRYHQQLMTVDLLAPALCEDLKATGCVLILIGEGNTLVRTAHDPSHPEVELAMEMMLAAIDTGTRQTLEEGATQVESDLNLPPLNEDEQVNSGIPEDRNARMACLKQAEEVGWDTPEGEALRERAKSFADDEELT